MSLAKTAELIEMPFTVLTRVGPRNHVLDGARCPKEKGQFWGLFNPLKSIAGFAVVYTKTAEPIEMLFVWLHHMGPRKHVLDGGQGWTNPFAAARGDKMVMWPFVRIL